ncbi:YcnI family protein [Micromonospora sp. NPDC049679]|uniref:YcnI family protein n=1 Tax=Micromonospora sp. NPDC049679 TaxID=3155920 RepID=UPI00340A4B57
MKRAQQTSLRRRSRAHGEDSGLRLSRGPGIAAIVGGAAVAGALAFAPAALADVTVSPSVAVRGDAAKITFEVPTERGPAYTTAVQLQFPVETPVAEVFPMSVPEWAPKITERKLDQPIEAIHGTRTSDVVSAITWTRAAPPPTAPGEVVRLPVSIGPLPDAERIAFTLLQTYSDGTVVRWGGAPDKPAAVLTLRPVPLDPHGAAEPGDDPAAQAAPTGDTGTAPLLGAGLAVGLGLAVGGWFIARSRRPSLEPAGPAAPAHPNAARSPDADAAEDDEAAVDAEPSRWRLRQP